MNNVIKRSVFALALLSLSGLTFAAKTGAYIGGGLGLSNLDTPKKLFDLSDIGPNESIRHSEHRGGLGARAFAGYNFNPYVGLELGYGHYASSKYSAESNEVFNNTFYGTSAQAKYNMYDIDLVGKGYLPLAESGFDLYALAGLAYVHSEAEANGVANINSEVVERYSNTITTKKIRPKYGIGAQYTIPNTGVTTGLELSRIQGTGKVKADDFDRNKHVIPSANMVTFNVAYNFG